MEIIKSINLSIAFLLELCLLAAFSYIGFHLGMGVTLGWIACIGFPVLVAILWGWVLAPHAGHRLEMPWLLIVKLVLFALAVVGLMMTDKSSLGVWFGIVSLIHFALAMKWKQL